MWSDVARDACYPGVRRLKARRESIGFDSNADSNPGDISRYSANIEIIKMGYLQDIMALSDMRRHLLTRIVAPKVAGSSLVGHPLFCKQNAVYDQIDESFRR